MAKSEMIAAQSGGGHLMQHSHLESHGSLTSPSGGEALFFKSFIPKQTIKGEQTAHLFFLPDLLDYHRGMLPLADFLLKSSPRNFYATLIDWKGLGLSSGPRAYINNIQEYIEDLDYVVQQILQASSTDRVVFIGQGMGALLGIAYLLQRGRSIKNSLAAVWANPLLAPSWPISQSLGQMQKLASHLDFVNKIKVDLPFSLIEWSSDAERVRELLSDPMVPKQLSLGLLRGIQSLSDQIRKQSYFLDVPGLFCLSDSNPINGQDLTKLFVKGIPNKRVDILNLNSVGHDLCHGPVSKIFYQQVYKWINQLKF